MTISKPIILVGFGGHAKSIIDAIVLKAEYSIVGYADIENKGCYEGIQWLGNDSILADCYISGVRDAFVSVGYFGRSNIRDSLYKRLKEIGFNLPVIIDATAVVSRSAGIGEGTFIGKICVVNA